MEDKFNFWLCFCVFFALFSGLSACAYDKGVCFCSGCDDCRNALNDVSCTTVKLSNSVSYSGATCINNPLNFNNKTFDCQGYEISGDDLVDWNHQIYGFYLYGKSGNKIVNCRINNFFSGIMLINSADTQIKNVNASSNGYGIVLFSSNIFPASLNNIIENSTIENNSRGVYLYFSDNNKITGNIIRNNTLEGIYSVQSYSLIKNNTINFNGFGVYFKNSGRSLVDSNIICSNGVDLDPDNFYGAYITDNDPYMGSENASVTIVEFSDFQCPYCKRFREDTLSLIEDNYIKTGKVKFVFRDFPLYFHEYAQKSAEASECADEQGRYWDYHNKLYENSPVLDILSLKNYASDLGLNTAQFNSCLDSGKYAFEVLNDFNAGSSLGVSGTPSFFINGIKVVGAQPYDTFKVIIDQLILTSDSYSNTGIENTCEGSNWNDAGFQGCTYPCTLKPIDCNCSTCGECSRNLNYALCPVVELADDISNYSQGTCISGGGGLFNKIFDCRGHSIEGDRSGMDYGVYLDSKTNNNTVINCAISGFYDGVYLDSSSNNTLKNNTINNNNNYGIYLNNFSDYNEFVKNTVNNNLNEGVVFYSSSNNTLFQNNVSGSSYGIDLQFNSNRNLLKENNAYNNINGIYLSFSSGNILNGNTANDNSYGISLYSSSNQNILNSNTAENNSNDGISLDYSSENNLSGNTADKNIWHGIFLSSSQKNILRYNNASRNKWYGVLLSDSPENTLEGNDASNNSRYGIYLYSGSDSNKLNKNTADNNSLSGIYLQSSSANSINENTVNFNAYGIYVFDNSSGNSISENTVSNNTRGITLSGTAPWGLVRRGSQNNSLYGNKISGNIIGINSLNSSSNISSNIVCFNTNPDFNSSDWLSSSGNNNTCDNPDGWNDGIRAGCSFSCRSINVTNYTIQLYSGWNLISIPLAPENTSIKSVLASVEGKYTKVGAWVNGTGKHYIPDFPFSTLTDIDEKMGFWIKMNQSGVLVVEGYAPENRSIPLQAGWNLVGYLSANKTLPLTTALSSISGNYTKVGAWVNRTGKHYIPGFPFNTLINMSEGYGYWIKMNSSGVLEYD